MDITEERITQAFFTWRWGSKFDKNLFKYEDLFLKINMERYLDQENASTLALTQHEDVHFHGQYSVFVEPDNLFLFTNDSN